MSAFLTPGNYTTYNTVASSYKNGTDGMVGGTGKIGSGLYQLNQGSSTGDTISFGNGIGTHFLVAADSNDTVNLEGTGWKKSGSLTDSTTGITGTLYKSGDTEVLVSGTDKVNGADGSTAPEATSDTNRDNLNRDIDAIENSKTNKTGAGAIDRVVTKDEVSNAIKDGTFDQAPEKKAFWQRIVDNFANYDKTWKDPFSNGNNGGNDHLINAGDIAMGNQIDQ